MKGSVHPMFFYSPNAIKAETQNKHLCKTTCPLCGGTLTRDYFIPLRYSPVSLLRTLILTASFAMLLGLLMYKNEAFALLLSHFSNIAQWCVVSAAVTLCFLAAYLMILVELKLGHRATGKEFYGLHCKRCKNGFAALCERVSTDVAYSSESPSSKHFE